MGNTDDTNPAGVGVRTSEFVISGGGIVAIGAVSLGVITADQADGFASLINTSIAGLGAIAAIFGIVLQWLKNRQEIKLKLLNEYDYSDKPAPAPAPAVDEVPAQ